MKYFEYLKASKAEAFEAGAPFSCAFTRNIIIFNKYYYI
jgi:hypothetical protein